MTIAVGVLTYNVYDTGRINFLYRTLHSLVGADHINLVTNGSTDGTNELVQSLGGEALSGNDQMWFGMQNAILRAASHDPDIIVFTADDIAFRNDWHRDLRIFWQTAPEDLALVSMFIEPEWPWNEVREVITDLPSNAVVPYLVIRDTAPGCCWSFRKEMLEHILPIPQQSPMEDQLVCQRLHERGFRIGQIELADHIGERHSAWGNESWKTAKPLDLSKYT